MNKNMGSILSIFIFAGPQRKLLAERIFPLHDLPIRQLQHAIHIFVHQRVMRGHQDGGALHFHDLAEQGENFARRGCIQFAGGFICQDQLRLIRQRAGNRNALLLPAVRQRGAGSNLASLYIASRTIL